MDRAKVFDPADMARCLPVVMDAVKRHAHRFAHIPDVSIKDLAHDYVLLIHAQRDRYDPAKAGTATWINKIVYCRICDLVKLHRRRKQRELRVAEENNAMASSAPEAMDPILQLRETYLAIAANVGKYIPPRRVGAPTRYTPAQRLALCWLRRKLATSARGLHKELAGNPAYMLALNLRHLPCPRTLQLIERQTAQQFKIV